MISPYTSLEKHSTSIVRNAHLNGISRLKLCAMMSDEISEVISSDIAISQDPLLVTTGFFMPAERIQTGPLADSRRDSLQYLKSVESARCCAGRRQDASGIPSQSLSEVEN